MRKPDLYVIARFLDALDETPGRTRSDLQRATRVNYDIFRRYLDHLIAKGLLEIRVVEGRELAYLTAHGLEARAKVLVWARDVLGMDC